MESLALRGGAPIVECATKKDGEEIDLGDLSIMPARHLHSKVVLSDGKPIPAGMRVTIVSALGVDSQTAVLSKDGLFEFAGLAKGGYTIVPSVKGYTMRSEPFTLDTDVSNYILTLDPQ